MFLTKCPVIVSVIIMDALPLSASIMITDSSFFHSLMIVCCLCVRLNLRLMDYVILLWHSLSLPYNYLEMFLFSDTGAYDSRSEFHCL